MKVLNLDDALKLANGKISSAEILKMKSVDKIYPVKTSEYYARLAFENPAAFKQAFPLPAELECDKFTKADPLLEENYEVVHGLIHKYKNKAIILTTNNCFMNCRHCTRKRLMHSTEDFKHPNYKAIFAYLEAHTEINDILLTGGDVLSLNDDFLLNLLCKLNRMPHMNTIRLGTRAPVTCPERINAELFGEIGKMKNIWVNTQFNHPCELTPQSIAACKIIQNNGIPICNQTVILKGVNDNYNTLRELFSKLVSHRIIPYYLYQCDSVEGVSHFIANPKIGAETVKKLRLELPGMAIPRFIVDTGYGKIVSEYCNLIEVSDSYIILTVPNGTEITIRYDFNSPKNE